jgi:hypothetical protein
MKKMLNEGNKMHNFYCVCENFTGCDSINYGSGFTTAKSYGYYGSGSATLLTTRKYPKNKKAGI